MDPLIGITASVNEKTEFMYKDNVKAITKTGGIPVMLSNLTKLDDITDLAKHIDGLYLTGGEDIDPTLYGEEPIHELGTVTPSRDIFELAITKKMLELKKPILGVCRGAQILNVVTGGNLYQDIYSQVDGKLLQHSQKAPKSHAAHFVKVEKNSLLYRLIGEEKIKVNTKHHQSVKNPGLHVQVVGISSDNIVEAIEIMNYPFALGVQWHPEGMISEEDRTSIQIYKGFIASCKIAE